MFKIYLSSISSSSSARLYDLRLTRPLERVDCDACCDACDCLVVLVGAQSGQVQTTPDFCEPCGMLTMHAFTHLTCHHLSQSVHCLIVGRSGPLQHRTEPGFRRSSTLLTAVVSSFSERALPGALGGCARAIVALEMIASTCRAEARSKTDCTPE